MAQITRFPLMGHLRSDPSHHVLHYRKGRLVRGGRGLAYWFLPLSASVAEVPCDDRELGFLFHARTIDFQDVTVQGVVTYRVADAEKLAARVDFSIDLAKGVWRQTPLEQISHTLSQLAQHFAWDYIAHTPVRQVLAEGVVRACDRIREGLAEHATLGEMGLEIVSVRVSAVSPTADLEKALQTPTREAIQQQADEATFQRRALAVEKERAIQENELQNKIELAKREELLIGQRGQNERRLAREHAEARAIAADARAARRRLAANVEADGIRTVQQVKVEAERQRIDVYRELPVPVLMGLAARRFAGKLQHIDHLNLGSDALGGALSDLIEASTRRLAGGNAKPAAAEVK
ncbi:MAG: SPFH domain-containing protein [Planctomycetes bacterium]|nr:SPFH domain-containing protein [Planctomycetota bacterium]MBI3846629.1 SPFH domain-containing protein [Planctomycetota bacterium]